MASDTGFQALDEEIAALADENLRIPSEAGKAALAFIEQDIDRIMARLDIGIAEEHRRLDAILESLASRPR